MKILITGSAGFIGYNFSKYLLDNANYKIIGIDNINNYYSTKIKKKRLKELKKYKKFKFYKIDIKNKEKLKKGFSSKINAVFHFAAQAGVRYSLINPRSYIESNTLGFFNMIEMVKEKKINKFFYASSSSVYGDSNKFPLKETHNINPKNIYGLTKKNNEEIAEIFLKNSSIKCIGLRFFTVFGEWGRPDMFMMKLFKAFKEKKFFYLNNFGNHSRDFTYIEDVVKILILLINKNIKGHQVFNICSNKPQNILNIVKEFNKKNKTKIKLIKMHKADVLDTHGDNKKIKKVLKIKKFSSFNNNFYKVLKWYKDNNINLIS